MIILYLLAITVRTFLSLLSLCMFLRAILSWFIMGDGSPIMAALHLVTEPFIAPVRVLLSRSRLFSEIPIDISFLIVFLFISILESVLPIPVL